MTGEVVPFLALDNCLLRDRGRFIQRLRQIKARQKQGKTFDQALEKLKADLNKSEQLVRHRQGRIPVIHYPEDLPISSRRDDIKKALQDSQVVVIAGETGSGKTTQIPKICLEMGLGIRGRIGHTQPRRIAARTVADRIAEELQTGLGDLVGYQVRFADHSTENTLIKLMTDGILLAEIQHDPFLFQYDAIIIDEAHERSLNIDFLMGYLKQILPKRPDLKIIITSATIDVDRFARHFGVGQTPVPVISVSGRTYPVEVRYRPPIEADDDILNSLVQAVNELLSLPERGDILVFLSGEREIREASAALRHANLRHIEVLPLYARLSLNEQSRIFKAHKGIRIILATNVAETSITVPGIRYVIDTGIARISRYSYKTKVQRLPIEPISQASANQRAGRCGRLSNGVCIRLYGQEDFETRSAFTDPEIVRTNLAAVILQMLQMKIGDIRDFPFVDMPDSRLINDGFQLLTELKAVSKRGELTETGRVLSKMPVDPRLGKMLVSASDLGALKELLVITSLLSIQDPRERPADKRQAADEKHRQWQDKESDFSSMLLLWHHFEEQRQALSRRKFSEYCHTNFVSYLRMREWRDLFHQLHTACRQAGLKENVGAADYDAIHKSILSGLLSHIGFRHQDREYLGVRNRKFHIFPGSGLAKVAPKWIVAAELLETSRLFAHQVSAIQDEWIPALAEHLIKKAQSEPYYDVRRGQVMAFERQTLFGLAVVERKRVPFGHIDRELSREIFIRGALVEGGYGKKARKSPFFNHNQQLLQELQELEDRLRRRDLLPDDEELYAFYNDRIPADVCEFRQFEQWRKKSETSNQQLLFLNRTKLLSKVHMAEAGEQFPKFITWQGIDYRISYRFEPGHVQDGVTVTMPAPQLHQVPNYLFDWLVPGLLRDKCIALVKGLPKQYRRQLVPVPDFIDKILPDLKLDNIPLTQALSHQLKRQTELNIPGDAWQIGTLDPFYQISYELVDERGTVLARSKDLTELKTRFRDRIQKTIEEVSADVTELSQVTEWSFGALKPSQRIKRGKLEIVVYPALVADETGISLKLVDDKSKADQASLRGVVQLFIQTYPDAAKYLRKHLFKGQELAFVAAGIEDHEAFRGDIIQAAYKAACLEGEDIPRSKDAFEACLSQGKNQIVNVGQSLENVIVSLLPDLKTVKRLMKNEHRQFAPTLDDCQRQLAFLFRTDFLFDTPAFWLEQYPRYLQALELRLDKLPGQTDKDLAFCREVDAFYLAARVLDEKIKDGGAAFKRDIQSFYYLIEEYRVSIFAQILKTAKPASAKRLQKTLADIERKISGG